MSYSAKYVHMKFYKIYTGETGQTKWGVLDGDTIRTLKDTPYNGIEYDGESVMLSGARLAAPCDATKIVAIGRNYYEHILEFGNEVPKEPIIFLKPTTAVTDPEGTVERPDYTERFDYEGEIAVVIKKKAKNVSKAEALNYILGYTALNDITARDIQFADGQWTRGKGLDGSAPIGPCVSDELIHNDIVVKTFLNGELRQNGNSNLMIWDIPSLIEYVSRYMTLLPGDVLTCGTPVNVGAMLKGDKIDVYVEGVGTLTNTII